MQALEPFTYRIGVPCVAGLIPADPRLGLQVVNVAAAVLLLFLLDAWLRRHLPSRVAVVLLAAFTFHWVAPLRQVWWYPTYIDPGALCAIVGALLASRRPGGYVPLDLLHRLAHPRDDDHRSPVDPVWRARGGFRANQ